MKGTHKGRCFLCKLFTSPTISNHPLHEYIAAGRICEQAQLFNSKLILRHPRVCKLAHQFSVEHLLPIISLEYHGSGRTKTAKKAPFNRMCRTMLEKLVK
jgi:hypothetical protein